MRFWPVVLLAVFFTVFFTLLFRREKHLVFAKPPAPGVVPSNSVFHRPDGADCPPGTTLMPEYFSEKDGSKRDACHNPKGDGSIDYLNPGEGCGIGVYFDFEDAEKPEQRKL